MNEVPKVFADFNNNADILGRLRLNCKGTADDLRRLNIHLSEGLELDLTDYDEFCTRGIVSYNAEENIWVAVIDWDNLGRIEQQE